MKLDKKTPIDMFSNKNIEIDDKFKNDLRKNLLDRASGKSTARGGINKRFAFAAAIPVLAVVIFSALAILPATNKSNTGGSGLTSLQPGTVKAAELIDETLQANKDNSLAYNFKHRTQRIIKGVGYEMCQAPEQTKGEYGTSNVYTYGNKEEDTYYFYANAFDDRGQSIYEDQDFSRYAKESVEFEQKPPGADVLESLQLNTDQQDPLYQLTDIDGNKISSSSDLVPIFFENKDVYQIFATPTLNVTNLCENGKDIYRITVDADTKDVISFDMYIDKVADSNLLSSSRESVIYKNLSSEEAKTELRNAGMDI